jgi:hypothetical protein
MVIAEIKPLDEIVRMVGEHRKVLVAGCAGCTAICCAGGQREVDGLAIALKERISGIRISTLTVERQCEMEFVSYLDSSANQSTALLSMACGAGVQMVAERYPHMPVLPAVNTTFIGVNRSFDHY